MFGQIPYWVIKVLTTYGDCYIKEITFDIEDLEKKLNCKVEKFSARDEDCGFILKLGGALNES